MATVSTIEITSSIQPAATTTQPPSTGPMSHSSSAAVNNYSTTSPKLPSSSVDNVDGSASPQATSAIVVQLTSPLPTQQVSVTPSTSASEATLSATVLAASSSLRSTPGLCLYVAS